MWPFKKKQTAPDAAASRYQSSPINLFFEDLILDILGLLPAQRSAAIDAMNLQRALSTRSTEWRDAVRAALHLSETFDIAVWDLWIRNRGHYEQSSAGHRHFAQNLADMYMADDSKVDVWPDGALEAAKERIAAAQTPNQSPEPTSFTAS